MSVAPPFSFDRARYDDTTVLGRFKNNLLITDPRLLLLSNAQVLEQVALLRKVKEQGISSAGATNEQLWYARRVKDSSVHPDTGEIIYRPFRMCGYVPYGTPIVLAMLLPVTANSLVLTGVSQVVNQSHNAAVNWANRSATKGGDPKADILRGYFSAVAASLSIGVGSNWLVNRMPFDAAKKAAIKRWTPFPAVCCASVSNMVMMRLPELERGITVRDDATDKELGESKLAARTAIQSTAIVRVGIVAGAVLLPQLLYTGCEMALKLHEPRRAAWRLPVQAFTCLFGFGLGVPVSLSCFTQEVRVPRNQLEPEFHGEGLARFNKGL